jgi:hypothetical protein
MSELNNQTVFDKTTPEHSRCSVCIFWNKSTLKYGVCEKVKDFQGNANLRFETENTAQLAMVMTHKSAICDFFARRSGKYISIRTKMMKAKKNNPLINPNAEIPEKKEPTVKKPAHISVLEKLFLKQKQAENKE